MKSPSVRKTSKKLLDSSSSSSSSSSSDEELRIRRNKTLPPQSPERRTVINNVKEKPENRHRPSSRSSVDQPRRRCHSGPRYRHHQQQYPTHPAAAGWHSWSPSPWGYPPPPITHPQCGYCCSPCQVIVLLEIGQRKIKVHCGCLHIVFFNLRVFLTYSRKWMSVCSVWKETRIHSRCKFRSLWTRLKPRRTRSPIWRGALRIERANFSARKRLCRR